MIDVRELREGNFVAHKGAKCEVVSTNPLIVLKANKRKYEVKEEDLQPIRLTDNIIVEKFGFIRDGWYIDEKNEVHLTGSRGKDRQYFLHAQEQENNFLSEPVRLKTGWLSFEFFTLEVNSVHKLQNLLWLAGNYKKIKL